VLWLVAWVLGGASLYFCAALLDLQVVASIGFGLRVIRRPGSPRGIGPASRATRPSLHGCSGGQQASEPGGVAGRIAPATPCPPVGRSHGFQARELRRETGGTQLFRPRRRRRPLPRPAAYVRTPGIRTSALLAQTPRGLSCRLPSTWDSCSGWPRVPTAEVQRDVVPSPVRYAESMSP